MTIHHDVRIMAPGLAEGPAYIHSRSLDRYSAYGDIQAEEVSTEQAAFKATLESVSGDLESLVSRTEDAIGAELAQVFQAHIAILLDPKLHQEVEEEIAEELVSAGQAVRTVFRRWERRIGKQGGLLRGDDLRDLTHRLVASLDGVSHQGLEEMPEDHILVARRLFPSDMPVLNRRRCCGLVLETGAPGSHVALFAHEMDIPCVSGIDHILKRIPAGAHLQIEADGARGQLIIDPANDERQRQYQRRQDRQERQRRLRDRLRAAGDLPVAVMANVCRPADVERAMADGAAGIGLYRTEHCFLSRQQAPSAVELQRQMHRCIAAAGEHPVTVRLLDIGADKTLPYLPISDEANPALGCRGIRFLLRQRQLLDIQLACLVRLAHDVDLRILVPMVTGADDMRQVRAALRDACGQANYHGDLPLGAMIETPAAALAAGNLAGVSDFFSVGTNDLTQFVFAADRENGVVDRYYDDTNEIIFRLIAGVREAAPAMPLSVCGEMAARPKAVARLIDCGVDSLSVAPSSVLETAAAAMEAADRTVSVD